jgi:hypothetical protein
MTIMGMVVVRRSGLLRRRDHLRAEWMLRPHVAGFAGPPVLGRRPDSHRWEVVLGHRGDPRAARLSYIRQWPFPSSRLAQCARPQALFKLLLIHADCSGDTDHAFGWDLALSDPEINRIHGNPESVGNFAHFCKSGRHRHYLVFSSKPTCTVKGQELGRGRKSVEKG